MSDDFDDVVAGLQSLQGPALLDALADHVTSGNEIVDILMTGYDAMADLNVFPDEITQSLREMRDAMHAAGESLKVSHGMIAGFLGEVAEGIRSASEG